MTRMTMIPIVLGACLFAPFCGTLTAMDDGVSTAVVSYERESDGQNGVDITKNVYHGDKTDFKRAVTIQYELVFDAIPAYQKIKNDNIQPDTAEYTFLLREANRVFKATLKKYAKKKNIDLIVEKGGIKVREEKIKDVTKQVIKAIE